MYIFVYICMYIFVYICIYICIYNSSREPLFYFKKG